MERRKMTLILLGLSIVLMAASVQAIPVNYKFSVTATSGPLMGVTAVGTFAFDSSIIPVGGGFLPQLNLLSDLNFTWHNITYDETTANTGWLNFNAAGDLIGVGFGTIPNAGGVAVHGGEEGWEAVSSGGSLYFKYAFSGPDTFIADGTFSMQRSVANSDVIYSTFGDPIGTSGLFVGTFTVPGDATYTVLQAATFTPSANYTLTSIDFAAYYYSGLNTLDIIVMSDSGGKPGSALETLTISNLGGLASYGTIYTVNSSGVTLTAGTQYWVVLEAEGNGLFAWNANESGDQVGVARKYTQGYSPGAPETFWVVSSQPTPFFDVKGTMIRPVSQDFDGDRKTDIAVYRASTGAWYVYPSGGGAPYGLGWGGDLTDKPVPGDYDGDGKTDIAVYRASTGAWYVKPSSGVSSYGFGWGGNATDNPVPGDYDGDGKTDIAVYRKSTGAWYVKPSSGASPYGVGWGGDPNDRPVPGDYDGDGKTDIAVYRASTGAWYVYPSSGSAPYGIAWGAGPTDKPVPGDYDGDGKTDMAVYRSNSGAWYVYPSGGSAPYGFGWGGDPNDKSVSGDYDGDGRTDIAVYRASTGAWYVYPSGGGAPYGVGWGGDATDLPVITNPGSYM